MAHPTAETFLEEGYVLLYQTRAVPVRLSAEQWDEWISYFGVLPPVTLELWIRVVMNDELPIGAKPKHLLWTLYFLRRYEEEVVGKVFLKADRKTIRKWIHPLVRSLSSLSTDLIDWNRRYESNTPVPGHYVYVDCSEMRIEEPRKPFSKGWSSGKFGKKAGVSYELATCIATGFIVWINGPFPAGDFCDIKIFDRDLILAIAQGERVLADSGYQGERVVRNSDNKTGARSDQKEDQITARTGERLDKEVEVYVYGVPT